MLSIAPVILLIFDGMDVVCEDVLLRLQVDVAARGQTID